LVERPLFLEESYIYLSTLLLDGVIYLTEVNTKGSLGYGVHLYLVSSVTE
jgi:hypothetical protein